MRVPSILNCFFAHVLLFKNYRYTSLFSFFVLIVLGQCFSSLTYAADVNRTAYDNRATYDNRYHSPNANSHYTPSNYGVVNPHNNRQQYQTRKFSKPSNSYFYTGLIGGMSFSADKDAVSTSSNAADINFSKDVKTGFYGGAVLGYKFGPGLRVELGGTYNTKEEQYSTTQLGNVRTIRVMGNAFYDIDLSGSIDPYLGAGVGISFIQNDIVQGNVYVHNPRTANAMTFMLGTGVNVGLSENLFLDVGYRFIFGNKVSFDVAAGAANNQKITSSIAAHNFQLGIKMSF